MLKSIVNLLCWKCKGACYSLFIIVFLWNVVTCTSLSLDRLKLWSSLKVPLIDDRPLEDNKREQFKKREKELENTGCKNPINY